MPECMVCGGNEFTPHDGYFYCNVCQTQTQELQEMEASYVHHGRIQTVRASEESKKKRTQKLTNKLGDGPKWTSWQAYNFILHGMTEEMQALGAPNELEHEVLRIWACYLNANEVAFCSKSSEYLPKLSFPFKYRDGKVLYDLDSISSASYKSKMRRNKRRRRRSAASSASKSTSVTSRSLKKMLHTSLYASQSEGELSQNEANVTLESIGRSSSKTPVKDFKINIAKKKHLTETSFRRRKESKGKDVSFRQVTKTKILAMIYIALLKLNHEIQPSDILRFIREGHLSFTQTSHFLPPEMTFGVSDVLYINSNKDIDMPTHKTVRQAASSMARFIRLKTVPVPDLPQLIRRYASDLLLPGDFAELAVRLLQISKPPRRIRPPRLKPLPAFDIIAAAALLVLFKLLLGMDGVTERRASHFASLYNRYDKTAGLFSFKEWQRAIECRNAVLTEYHYPTREQLAQNEIFDSKYAVDFLQNTQKDPYLRNRQLQVNIKKNESAIVDRVMGFVTGLNEKSGKVSEGPVFRPSLQPGVNLLKELMDWMKNKGEPNPPWLAILNKDWNLARITHLTHPQDLIQKLRDGDEKVVVCPDNWLQSHMKTVAWIRDKLSESEKREKYLATVSHNKGHQINSFLPICPRPVDVAVYQRNDHNYWLLRPPKKLMKIRRHSSESELDEESSSTSRTCTCETTSRPLSSSASTSRGFYASSGYKMWTVEEFEADVTPLFSSTWLWLLTHFSRVLNAPKRDVYTYVLHLEDRLLRILNIEC